MDGWVNYQVRQVTCVGVICFKRSMIEVYKQGLQMAWSLKIDPEEPAVVPLQKCVLHGIRNIHLFIRPSIRSLYLLVLRRVLS